MKESDDMFCNYDQYKDKEVVKKHEQLLKQLGEKDRVFSLEWNEEPKKSAKNYRKYSES